MVEIVPRLTEIADFRRSVNRRMWAVITLLGLTSLGALFLALLGFTRPVPVVMFDGDGRPMLFEDTATPRTRLTRMRVEYFAEAFLDRFVAVDSATVGEDFAAALNMMTPDLRAIMLADAEEAERRRGVAEGNVRGTLIGLRLEVAAFDPEAINGRIYVVAVAQLRMQPRFGRVDSGPGELTRHLLTELALQRVPISREAIHGLRVDYVHSRFFADAEALEAEALRRSR